LDWKLFTSTFALVFLAELGDKTQLAAFTLAASGRSRLVVFVAASLALAASTAIAVLAGEAVARAVPEVWVRRLAGLGFLVLGALLLARSS